MRGVLRLPKRVPVEGAGAFAGLTASGERGVAFMRRPGEGGDQAWTAAGGAGNGIAGISGWVAVALWHSKLVFFVSTLCMRACNPSRYFNVYHVQVIDWSAP